MKSFNLVLLLALLGTIRVHGQNADSVKTKTAGLVAISSGSYINSPLYVITEDKDKMFVYSGRNFTHLTPADDILEKINHRWINSVTVLKDENAVDQYGIMGQHGVIVISVKDGSLNKMPPDLKEKFQIE